jgi:D-galacturonate reductase
MKYVPSQGKFAGQLGYGYRSLEAFIDAVRELNAGRLSLAECDDRLATLSTTFRTTAILEAGRRSLDEKRTIKIIYDDSDRECAGGIEELRAVRCRPIGLI